MKVTPRTQAMIQFGNALRDARVGLNARLQEVADHIGVSVPYLSDVENGRRPLSDERIVQLAEYLHTDVLPLLELASLYRGKITLDISGSTGQQIRAALLLAQAWPNVPGATVDRLITELKDLHE